MSLDKKILDHVDSHLAQVSDMTIKQNQEVDALIEDSKKNIEAFNAFDVSKDINEEVTKTIKSINEELDSAIKDINEQLEKIQLSTN